jgi:tight adherence protein C
MDATTIVLASGFCAALLLIYSLSGFVSGGKDRDVKRRMTLDAGTAGGIAPQQGQGVSTLLTKITEAASKPLEPRTVEDRSQLRKRLGYAGHYSPTAGRVLVGTKLLLLIGGLAVGYFIGIATHQVSLRLLLFPCALGIAGLLAPELWLSWAIKHEQTAIEHALPDALDLMVVCVESGLTMDASMQRVSKEIALAHPALARELAITHIETQMGVARGEALRKLAARTGSGALKSLTAMLIQADRFGTSVAGALRVYSDSLRVKRQFAAQEMAAKASVKLTFPLVFCIFPAVLVVAGGPALIQLTRLLHTK